MVAMVIVLMLLLLFLALLLLILLLLSCKLTVLLHVARGFDGIGGVGGGLEGRTVRWGVGRACKQVSECL